jgi:hypothetical protein
MKLTVPAIRVAEPDPARQQAYEHTVVLLEAIDTLLAETAAQARNCTRPGQHGGRGPRRPISPAA